MEFYYHLKRCRSLRKFARLYMPVIMDMFSLEPLDITTQAYRKESGYSSDTIKKRLAEIGIRIVRNQSRQPGFFEVEQGYRGLDPSKHPNVRFRQEAEPPPLPDDAANTPIPDRKRVRRQPSKEWKLPGKQTEGNRNRENGPTRCEKTVDEPLHEPVWKQDETGSASARIPLGNRTKTKRKPLYIRESRENSKTFKPWEANANARERRPPPKPIPHDFGWTDNLDRWALEKYPATPRDKLRGFLEVVFIPQNLAKDYRYADHERAFMVWVARELVNPRGWFSAGNPSPRRSRRRAELEAQRREKFKRFCHLVEVTDARA